MKLHFVLQQLDRALFAIDAPHSKEAVKQYLYAAKAELKRFCPKSPSGDVTCSRRKLECPFMEYDEPTDKHYCILSKYYLHPNAEGFLEPREGCTWQE